MVTVAEFDDGLRCLFVIVEACLDLDFEATAYRRPRISLKDPYNILDFSQGYHSTLISPKVGLRIGSSYRGLTVGFKK